MRVIQVIKALCPPIIFRLLSKAWYARVSSSVSGNYSSWDQAKLHSSGYDDMGILEQVKNAALKVRNGEAVFERDSVCFYQEDYRWPTLACLLFIAAEQQGELNVLDFGGALGSFYFQHKKFFSRLNHCQWSVVEQKHFVEFGMTTFKEDQIKFYALTEQCIKTNKIDVIFLSSVLQYLESPYLELSKLLESETKYLLIDRTPFINSFEDRLAVQNVPANIYKASYPAWFFSRQKFDGFIEEAGYRLMSEFACEDDLGFGEYKGMLYERI